MLMNKGELDGVRILGRNTVDFMTRNGLTPEQRKTLNWDSTKGHGYGNFMRILEDPSTAGLIQSEGSFGWDGWMGCYFSIDPKNSSAYYILSSRQAQALPILQGVCRTSHGVQ